MIRMRFSCLFWSSMKKYETQFLILCVLEGAVYIHRSWKNDDDVVHIRYHMKVLLEWSWSWWLKPCFVFWVNYSNQSNLLDLSQWVRWLINCLILVHMSLRGQFMTVNNNNNRFLSFVYRIGTWLIGLISPINSVDSIIIMIMFVCLVRFNRIREAGYTQAKSQQWGNSNQ